ncbi:hypothetical protein [Parabacteroides goldsteinii]|uniref:hypothetical protein n=1 Tax=Parabacteroides goldsteinii TaxID=328812 RepID=UPI0032B28F3D
MDNEYRVILFAIDKPNLMEARKVLLNGFIKKSTKNYKRDKDRLETFKGLYRWKL